MSEANGDSLHCHVLRFRRMERFVPPPVSGRRIAAARRAVERDKDRNALTPELVRHHTPEERLNALAIGMDKTERDWRDHRAQGWRSCRRRLRNLPEITRKGVVRLWNLGICPLEPHYLAGYIHAAERGESPWRKMAELRRLRLVASGKMARPASWSRKENATNQAQTR